MIPRYSRFESFILPNLNSTIQSVFIFVSLQTLLIEKTRYKCKVDGSKITQFCSSAIMICFLYTMQEKGEDLKKDN